MIQLRMLGTLDLKGIDGRAVHSILAQPKRLALLAYLAIHTDQGARRDSVVALFWPELDTAHARGALRQSLRFLRRELGVGILNGHSDEALAFESGTGLDKESPSIQTTRVRSRGSSRYWTGAGIALAR
jgi:DNA-binding SARP family transcriptional activator